MTQSVTIYTTRFCPYCVRAKHLLQSKGVTFNEIPVDGDYDKRQELQIKTGQSTVPQIWVGDNHVGGCDELYALERNQQLDKLLELED